MGRLATFAYIYPVCKLGMPSVSNGILLRLRESAQGPFINIPSKEI